MYKHLEGIFLDLINFTELPYSAMVRDQRKKAKKDNASMRLASATGGAAPPSPAKGKEALQEEEEERLAKVAEQGAFLDAFSTSPAAIERGITTVGKVAEVITRIYISDWDKAKQVYGEKYSLP